jgi:hypothetical protein
VFRVQVSEFRVRGFGFRFWGLDFRVEVSRRRVKGSGFRVRG